MFYNWTGIHVRQWIDMNRARVFFNYLCNEYNEWAGDDMKGFY